MKQVLYSTAMVLALFVFAVAATALCTAFSWPALGVTLASLLVGWWAACKADSV